MKHSTLEQLFLYHEDELFYREYDRCRGNPEQLKKLIAQIGPDEIRRRGLLVPEIDDAFMTPFEMGEGIFREKKTQNICLSKHNRYTPEFLHSHTFFEMIYVLNGSCRHTISGKTMQLSSGTFCIVAPHVYHAVGVFDDSVILNILIRTSTLEELYASLLKRDNLISSFLINGIFSRKHAAYLQFQMTKKDELQQLILEMYQEQMADDAYSEAIINNLLLIFLYRLIRRYGTTAELLDTQIQKNDTALIYRYFIEHYQNASLVCLAATLGYTPAYCSAYVKKVTGFTFSQLLKKFRFRKAEDFLCNTKLSVHHISELLGYSDSESFIHAFKKAYGMSPETFRKNGLFRPETGL